MKIESTKRPVIVAALLAVVAAGGLVAVQLVTLPASDGAGVPYATTLQHTSADARERLLVRGDGQFFAALATDPSLSRPEVLRTTPSEYSYRWIRPLYSWLGWAGSLGRASAVPTALLALTVLSAGVLVAGTGMLAQSLGRDPAWTLGCLLLPGTLVILSWTGSEALAAGLALAGSSMIVQRRAATASAVSLLVLGVLARETLLLVCIGLAAWLWIAAPRSSRSHALAVMAWPGAILAAWLMVVRWRTGSSPLVRGSDRLTVPFDGLIRAIPNWSEQSVVMIGVMVVLVVCGVARAGHHRSAVVAIAMPTLAFATMSSEAVWQRWEDISRVMLPACAVLLVAALPRTRVTGPVLSD